jgi:hypothetical protein
MEVLVAAAAIVLFMVIGWLVRQGPARDGESLPGNRDRADLGGP